MLYKQSKFNYNVTKHEPQFQQTRSVFTPSEALWNVIIRVLFLK